jgi:acyl-coenzyme A synthetase/AMP-(fatty) acid ligase
MSLLLSIWVKLYGKSSENNVHLHYNNTQYIYILFQLFPDIISYLYNQPEQPQDKLHDVRIFVGNGVNPAIWKGFVERFNNVKIVECYGCTEGNCSIGMPINITGHKT